MGYGLLTIVCSFQANCDAMFIQFAGRVGFEQFVLDVIVNRFRNSDKVDEPSETATSVGTTTVPNDDDLIAGLIVFG
jgi:hypothetical protein